MTEDGPNMYRCEKCQQSFPTCDYRYVMSISVADDSGQVWVNAFNESAQVILGKSAGEMMEYRENVS